MRSPTSRGVTALTALGLCLLAISCRQEGATPPSTTQWAPDADARGHTAPTARTIAANGAVAEALPLDDATDFENARRGLLASEPEIEVGRGKGPPVWRSADYAFVQGEAPGSVNPSLWRQAKLNGIHGLFEVVPGVYQLRGYDLSNITLIEGESGWIVVDPGTSRESAAAAMALAARHFGERPVVAVLFTHSHIDHFGGVEAVLPEDEAARAAIRIVAPRAFVHEATSENVMAGVAMLRRAAFMYGMPLARSPRGHVDTGLGKEPARGSTAIAIPTDEIDHTGQELVLDGVRFLFQYTPHSEAPAEFTFYLPDQKALCGAEIVSHNLHNLYTLRGAKVRDALVWSGYIDEMLQRFGDAEVIFASHHWPTWGRLEVARYLTQQRDTYKFIHDQTLRLANNGLTPREIAEQLELPSSLRSSFANRGYYGTVRHNAKAVYQWYFGWYDAHPANLDPLPPVEEAKHYVAFMGGADALLTKARESFEAGEYRFTATVLSHLVMAEPQREDAREMLARCFDQLGYVAESGPWRDVYLTGAHELRHGIQPSGASIADSIGMLKRVPIARFFDSLAARVDGVRADGAERSVRIDFRDTGESYVLWIENAVLHHRPAEGAPPANATIETTRDFFLRLGLGQVGIREAVFSDELELSGSLTEVAGLFSLLDPPKPGFPIVTP